MAAPSPEPDEREGEAQWEKIEANSIRPLVICDIDFSDLREDDEEKKEGHFKLLLLKKPLGHHYKAEMLQIQ